MPGLHEQAVSGDGSAFTDIVSPVVLPGRNNQRHEDAKRTGEDNRMNQDLPVRIPGRNCRWGGERLAPHTAQSFAGETDLRGMAVSAMTQVKLDPQSPRAGRPCHDIPSRVQYWDAS